MLSLVNNSSHPDIDLTLMANAMNQSAHDWAAPWYGHPPIVSPHPGHQWTMQLVDTDKNAPGALAYHEDANAIPDAVVMVDAIAQYIGQTGAELYYGPGGVIVGATHEWLEMLGDLWCNRWSVNWDTGQAVADENSDPVESFDYEIVVSNRHGQRVPANVTNFVLPAWSNNGGHGPYDHLQVCSQPFEIASGGYCVVADISNESEITAEGAVAGKLMRPPERPARFGALRPGEVKIEGMIPKSHGYRTMRRFGLTRSEEIQLQELDSDGSTGGGA